MNYFPMIFFLLVFVAVFMFVRALGLQAFGPAREASRAVSRLGETAKAGALSELRLLRRPHLEFLTPFEKKIEARPELRRVRRLIDQAGLKLPAYRVLLDATACAMVAAAVVALYSPQWWLFLVALPAAAMLPFVYLIWRRGRRIAQIESRLADAIDMVKRSLRAGNPLVATFRSVAENLDGPLATEFALTAADLSYGSDPRQALLSLIDRVPSVPLMGFITAILVQRETGGNLAETLDHISAVIRERFKFDRKLRSLSAEGRLSAWILTLVPFVLAAVLSIRAPDYIGDLIEHPRGPVLLTSGGVLMLVGLIWMRRIVRIVI